MANTKSAIKPPPKNPGPPQARLPGAPSARRPVRNVAGVPAYRQIMTDLGQRLNSGEFHEGEVLVGEPELAQQYGVSRMTVRQALAGLAEQGLVERRQGRGTVVTRHKFSRELQRPIGLTEEIRASGRAPGSHILRLEEIKPDAATRYALWVGPRARVVLLSRLRFADGVLVGLQDSYIPVTFAPGLAALDLEDKSLSAVLRERHGLVASYAELTIESIEANCELARALGVGEGTALLKSTSLSYLPQGRPLEQTVGWFLGSRYSYRLVRGAVPPSEPTDVVPTRSVPANRAPRHPQ
jgi:GntR family transcriptional regulator